MIVDGIKLAAEVMSHNSFGLVQDRQNRLVEAFSINCTTRANRCLTLTRRSRDKALATEMAKSEAQLSTLLDLADAGMARLKMEYVTTLNGVSVNKRERAGRVRVHDELGRAWWRSGW